MSGSAKSRATGRPGIGVMICDGASAAKPGSVGRSPASKTKSARHLAIIDGAADIRQNARLFMLVYLPAEMQIETFAGFESHAEHTHVPVAGLVHVFGRKLRPVKRGARRLRHAAALPDLLPIVVELHGARPFGSDHAPVGKVEAKFPRRGFVAQYRHKGAVDGEEIGGVGVETAREVKPPGEPRRDLAEPKAHAVFAPFPGFDAGFRVLNVARFNSGSGGRKSQRQCQAQPQPFFGKSCVRARNAWSIKTHRCKSGHGGFPPWPMLNP